VEVGSSLRSAAAFGFRDILLEDRGAGWFRGPAGARRKARAAARRHKNPIRVRPATVEIAQGYDEIVLVRPFDPAAPLSRQRLSHGNRQLISVGASPDEIPPSAAGRVRIVSLGLRPAELAPLRLIASIALAEVSRQVGRRRPLPGPPPRAPRYEKAIELEPGAEVLLVEPDELLDF
jgi:hypothetical protein